MNPLIEALGMKKEDFDGNISGEATPEIWKAEGRNRAITELESKLKPEEEAVETLVCILMQQEDLLPGEHYVDFMKRLSQAIYQNIGSILIK